MCGIVGYAGPQAAVDVLVEGLRRLEYRGYDSAGVAIVSESKLYTAKKAGKLGNLEKLLSEEPLPRTGLGIGHTRWATHGAPTDVNAHPHISSNGRIALIHNGIIENYVALREELKTVGIAMTSETDTEVVAHLLGQQVAAGQPRWPRPCAPSAGGCRARSPWWRWTARPPTPWSPPGATPRSWWESGEGENFVASDVAAFIEHTREAIELGQDQVVTITPSSIEVTTFDGSRAEVHPYHVDWDLSAAEKGGFDWFMRKEIYEQPKAVADTLLGRHDAYDKLTLDEIRIPEAELRSIDKIIVIACGTSFYAGLVAKYAIEHWTRIPCEVELASEFRYRDPIVGPRTLVVAISQSGETADTLMALRHAREQRARVLSICNTNGSTMPRESDAVIYTHAGPEIGVASTKGFLTQLVACYLLGLYLAQVRGTKFGDEIRAIMRELASMPGGDHVGAGQHRGGPRAGPRLRRRAVGAVPRPARRLPGGPGGGAQAQGAGLHPRRGFRRRRAQARPDRPDRGPGCRYSW